MKSNIVLYGQIPVSIRRETGTAFNVSDEKTSVGSEYEGVKVGNGEVFKSVFYKAEGEGKHAVLNIFERDEADLFKAAQLVTIQDYEAYKQAVLAGLSDEEVLMAEMAINKNIALAKSLKRREIYKYEFEVPEELGLVFVNTDKDGEQALKKTPTGIVNKDGLMDLTTLKLEMKPATNRGFSWWSTDLIETEEGLMRTLLEFGRFEKAE